ncbi:MAG: Nif3-like dinuclear metal center hexameric protein, partial [Defluviitaleaceae bacterium]|nr:Nif3-like dinuclear metal center hexameric protein [Defluviitaleaceae bacterium]
ADGGTNDALFELLGLTDKEQTGAGPEGGLGIGRAGRLHSPAQLRDFAEFTRKMLGLNSISFCGDGNTWLKKIGVCAGGAAGAKYAGLAAEAGCDCYVTGDIGYHDAQAIADMGLCAVDATHYASETPVLARLEEYLRKRASEAGFDVNISIVDSGAGMAEKTEE